MPNERENEVQLLQISFSKTASQDLLSATPVPFQPTIPLSKVTCCNIFADTQPFWWPMRPIPSASVVFTRFASSGLRPHAACRLVTLPSSWACIGQSWRAEASTRSSKVTRLLGGSAANSMSRPLYEVLGSCDHERVSMPRSRPWSVTQETHRYQAPLENEKAQTVPRIGKSEQRRAQLANCTTQEKGSSHVKKKISVE